VSITAQVARGFPGMVHTGAARAGVEVRTAICAAALRTDEPVQNMTMTLSVEWSPYNINVCK
jgi:citronellol/citronellal dehydrogenase